MNIGEQIIIPIIDNINLSLLLASDLVNVQPMTDGPDDMFKMKVTYSPKHRRTRFGNVVHCILQGWKAYDGKEYIIIDEFVERYPDLHYEELANLSGCPRIQ
jgi:hypothetical protein